MLEILLSYLFLVNWQIKKIDLEETDSPQKFDELITAIRSTESQKGVSTILWDVWYDLII